MQDQKASPQDKKKLNSYIEYSSVSFQMLAVIILFALTGNRIDVYFNNPKPFITALLAIIGVATALYIALKKIKK